MHTAIAFSSVTLQHQIYIQPLQTGFADCMHRTVTLRQRDTVLDADNVFRLMCASVSVLQCACSNGMQQYYTPTPVVHTALQTVCADCMQLLLLPGRETLFRILCATLLLL